MHMRILSFLSLLLSLACSGDPDNSLEPRSQGELSTVCLAQPQQANEQVKCSACEATGGVWQTVPSPFCACPHNFEWRENIGVGTLLGCTRTAQPLPATDETGDHFLRELTDCATVFAEPHLLDVAELCRNCVQEGGLYQVLHDEDPVCVPSAGGTIDTIEDPNGDGGGSPDPTPPPQTVDPSPPVDADLAQCRTDLSALVTKDHCRFYATAACMVALDLDETRSVVLKEACVTCFEEEGTWFTDPAIQSGNRCVSAVEDPPAVQPQDPPPPQEPIEPTAKEVCATLFGLDTAPPAAMTKEKCEHYARTECAEGMATTGPQRADFHMFCDQCLDMGKTWTVDLDDLTANRCSIDVTCAALLNTAGSAKCAFYDDLVCYYKYFDSTLVIGNQLRQSCETCHEDFDTWYHTGAERSGHYCKYNPVKPL